MKNCYCEDSTVPGLLMFCCCTPLVECRLYIESQIIIQDKVGTYCSYDLRANFCLNMHTLQ